MSNVPTDAPNQPNAANARNAIIAGLNSGQTADQIAIGLANDGWPDDVARALVEEVISQRLQSIRTANRQAGLHQMKVGGAWCVGGIVITAMTYASAQRAGGTYVVTWGAILFGFMRFMVGLSTYMKS